MKIEFNIIMSTNPLITLDEKTYILSGGPDPENYDDGCSSLGQLIIKRLKEIGDKILLVTTFKNKSV